MAFNISFHLACLFLCKIFIIKFIIKLLFFHIILIKIIVQLKLLLLPFKERDN